MRTELYYTMLIYPNFNKSITNNDKFVGYIVSIYPKQLRSLDHMDDFFILMNDVNCMKYKQVTNCMTNSNFNNK